MDTHIQIHIYAHTHYRMNIQQPVLYIHLSVLLRHRYITDMKLTLP